MRYFLLSLLVASSLVACRRSGCTDARALNYDDKAKNNDGSCFYADSAKAIGNNYGGGIICYHFKQNDVGYVPGETHGLIMVPQSLGTALWGCAGGEITGADEQQVGAGEQNTIDITNGCNEAGIAARLVFESSYNGYNDWFLPSYNELRGIFENRMTLSLPQTTCWSSSEDNASNAYYVNMADGIRGAISKNLKLNVIAVRKF
ncbi:MAG: DUF1566 domain-containing protein [Chitinophagaceae bacterium]